jgi:hypothetical protein
MTPIEKTFSRRPWSLKNQTDIIDANGDFIGGFIDWRNSDAVIKDFNDTDQRTRQELIDDIEEAERSADRLSTLCDNAVLNLENLLTNENKEKLQPIIENLKQ